MVCGLGGLPGFSGLMMDRGLGSWLCTNHREGHGLQDPGFLGRCGRLLVDMTLEQAFPPE